MRRAVLIAVPIVAAALVVVVAGVALFGPGEGATTAVDDQAPRPSPEEDPEEDGGLATADETGDPDRAPPDRFEMFDGSSATMADYEGRPVIVNFWASWCPPCIAEMPEIEEVHQRFAGEVAFLGINTQDDPTKAEGLVEQTGVTYDLARDPDGALFQAWGVFGMPTTFFVSADGEIVHEHTGIISQEMLVDRIEADLLTDGG